MRVRVYWNLHRKVWSVLDPKRRIVIAHVSRLTLTDVRFLVSEATRQRVIATKKKRVHAFAEGEAEREFSILRDGAYPVAVTYSPYRAGHFTAKRGEEWVPIAEAEAAYLDPQGGVYVAA